MPNSPPKDLRPTDSPTTNGHPTHVAGTHIQRMRSLDTEATKIPWLIRRWAIMDQTGRQTQWHPNRERLGGFSGKTKLSGYTTLFGTREQSCYASSHFPSDRRDSPPRAQIKQEREVEREEAKVQIAKLDYTRDTQEETANSLFMLAVLWI